MTFSVTPPVASIFGTGAPSEPAANGVRYFDTSANPYAEYVSFGGVWSGPLGGGGGGGSNVYAYPPNGVIFGYGGAFVPSVNQGPYADLYAGNGANDASYSYGGNVNIGGGQPGTAPHVYGGDVSIFGGTVFNVGTYAYGGNVSITAGTVHNAVTYANGGNVYIGTGSGNDATNNYGGDMILALGSGSNRNGRLVFQNLPGSNPGGTGRVWNNMGVLNIT